MKSHKNINYPKYLFIFLICGILSFIFVSGVFLHSIKDNPIKLNINIENKLFTFTPQGWAFFTRNPREAQVIIYTKNTKNHYEEIQQRHSSYKNLFGLKRNASKIMSEMQFIKAKINDTLYKNTKWNFQSNIYSNKKLEIITIDNQMKNPLLCGEYFIVYQKAVPWAWSSSIEKIKMPAKIIRLKINCNDKEP